MHVFLLPLGGNRHELYCEVADDDTQVVEGHAEPGWWGRLRERFRRMVADAEDERAREDSGQPSAPKETSGIARWVVRKIVEAIAELRLLWLLRRAPAGILVHADDLDSRRALELARAMFAKDYRKHRRWCGIDAVIAAVTGAVFFFVPGPNLIGWYFAFRSWGHFRAFRGAARALDGLSWQMHPSPHLSALREAIGRPPVERHARLKEIEQALDLDKLAAFVERVARHRT
jgi:hypothetical protein